MRKDHLYGLMSSILLWSLNEPYIDIDGSSKKSVEEEKISKLVDEYFLILQKESRLSRRQREKVVADFEDLMKKCNEEKIRRSKC